MAFDWAFGTTEKRKAVITKNMIRRNTCSSCAYRPNNADNLINVAVVSIKWCRKKSEQPKIKTCEWWAQKER